MDKKSEKPKTPGMIERKFRKELGEINPYLCLVDSAVSYFITETKSQSNQAQFLRTIAGKYGHNNLYTEHLNVDDLNKFVHSAHIALINSKAESACKEVQRLIFTESKTINEKLKDEVQKYNSSGDFYRKALLQIHCYKNGTYSFVERREPYEKSNEQIYPIYIGYTELKVLDYFRLTRNNILHNSKNDENLIDIFKEIDQDFLKEKYKLPLNEPENIAFTDVLLLSKVWQESIKQICRKCLNMSEVNELLQIRYKEVSSERRKNGIIQTLMQEYLQTDEDIRYIIDNLIG